MLNSEETLAQKFVRRGFWLYLFAFLAWPLSYFIKVILARDLTSVHDFGLFYGIISLITLLTAFNDLGTTESLNYFLPKYLIRKEYGKAKYLIWLVFLIQITSSTVIVGGLWLLSDTLATEYFHDPKAGEILRIIALFFLGTNLLHICGAIFGSTQNTKFQKGIEFFRIFATLCFMFVLFFLDQWTLVSYTWAWVSAVFVATLFAVFLAWKYYYVPYFRDIPLERDTALRRAFLVYALPTFLTANIGMILSQIDAQIVTVMLWNEAQGYYSNYISIMSIPFLIVAPLVGFLFPVITELHTRWNTHTMLLLHRNITLLFIIISFWISLGLYQIGTPLTILLFGESYQLSGYILQFSCFFVLFNLLNQINFQFLAGTGRAWSRTLILSIILPVNIILNIILIRIYGVAWSALAVGLSWVPLYILSAYFTREYQSIPPWKPIIINILACGMTGGIVMGILHFFTLSPFVFFLVAVLVYFGIFIAVNMSFVRQSLHVLKTHRS